MSERTATTANPVSRGESAQRGEKKGDAGFVLLIGLLTLLPAVTTDIYLPSLPDVEADLRTDEAGAQFTITGMLIGGALGQLLVGPFSDRVGRRKPVIIGIALHIIISLLCIRAGSITELGILRVSQGLASAGATVVALAIIRDRYSGSDAARMLSRLMLVIAAAPLLAPTLGSLIAGAWGWRGVFGALAAFGAVLLAVVLRFLPETLPASRRSAHGFRATFGGYSHVLKDRRFVAFAVIPGLSMALIMSYVSGSPFVFQGEYGLSPQQFSLAFAAGGTSLILGSQVNAYLVKRFDPVQILRVGLPAATLASGMLFLVAFTRSGGILTLIGFIWVTTVTLGFVMANASALALSRHGERAGTAAAVMGCFQGGVAGLVSPLVGLLGGDRVAMTGVMLGSVLTATLVLVLFTPAYQRRAKEAVRQVRAEPKKDITKEVFESVRA